MSLPDEIEQMLVDCENRESKLSEWEHGFVQSLREQFDRTGSISETQDEILERIWNKVT